VSWNGAVFIYSGPKFYNVFFTDFYHKQKATPPGKSLVGALIAAITRWSGECFDFNACGDKSAAVTLTQNLKGVN
jgi:hypothetical protein